MGVELGLPPPEAYLDHAATTPTRPEVVEAMLPWLSGPVGNPSGSHARARAARRAIDEAREPVAELLGCAPGEVVFTSGGTEADDLAVNGTLDAVEGLALCSAVEHHAVLDPVVHRGGAVIPVDRSGVVDLDALGALLVDAAERHARGDGPAARIVSVMTANNEVGTVQPIEEVCDVVARHAPDAVVHTDAVQAAAWCDLRTVAAGASLISVSGHKVGGPKGVGALAVRPGVALAARLRGGGQERGRRSGTHNVAGIVGLGEAARLVLERRDDLVPRLAALRDALEAVATSVDGVTSTVGGPGGPERLPTIAHVCISGVVSEALLFLLDDAGISASAASSCASGATEPSHVLAAMGVPADVARGSLRLSLGWDSTDVAVERLADVFPAAVTRLRLFDVPAGRR